MSLGVVVMLLCALPSFASFGAAPCKHGTCDGTTKARKHAGVMLQKVSATQRIATSEKEDGPNDGQYIKVSTRVADMEARVTKLEEVSLQGRESLKTQLADLTTAVDTMQSGGTGSLDDTTSRVSASEGTVSTVEETVATTNAALRKGVEVLTEEYEGLAKNVGEAFASLSALQTGASQEPAAAAATAAPVTATPVAVGGGLSGRTTALETRVASLEGASGNERETLKAELVALDKRVDAIRAGGSSSLEHTTTRVGSAEERISTLHANVDASTASIRANLAALKADVADLSAKVGSGAAAMLQTAGVKARAKSLPLTDRITSLEERIASLEDKSSTERGTLQSMLEEISGKVEDIKAGGVSSLEHATLRQSSVETDSAALTSFVMEQKASLEADTGALKADLDRVRASVGASLLEAA